MRPRSPPAVALALSAVSVIWALTRAARAVQRQLRRLAVGPGPSGSVIVGGSSVVVAAAGISRPRVVVSAGALTAFDDAELAVSVDHEHGHIARRHRFAVVFGELCRAVGRLVPGARRAIEELEFHLERDADEYAVARLHDPLDLASAICKAAGTGSSRGAVLSLYGSRKVTHRVRLLTQDHGRISSDFVNRCATAAAVGMTTLVLALVVSIPAATAAGMSRAPLTSFLAPAEASWRLRRALYRAKPSRASGAVGRVCAAGVVVGDPRLHWPSAAALAVLVVLVGVQAVL